jgi:hypothetical protein
MTYFAEDTDYSYQFFDGETVPGDNTVQTARHTFLKDKAHNKVKWALGIAIASPDPTDTYGQLKDAELFCYGVYLNNPLVAFMEGSEELHTLKSMLATDKSPALRVTKKYQSAAWTPPTNPFNRRYP